jgi:sugar transferase (PEP-CTERM/EpsH1 system associated)
VRDILYLVHRIPFPPNKGDKVRSYHLLRQLAGRFRVHLGCFVDDEDDWQHVDALRPFCAGLQVCRLDPRRARLRSLRGFLGGEALTVPYYADAGMRAWVDDTLQRHGIDRAVVYSSAMAQYVMQRPGLHRVVDFVDVDSAKWAEYAEKRRWPWSAVFRREARLLLDYDRRVARGAAMNVLVTPAEAELFRGLAPESAGRIQSAMNGVDTDFFSPAHALASPFPEGVVPIVFTGAMDYWPNVDAVTWFADESLPALQRALPAARFYIVGMNPAPEVRALGERSGIEVTGRVPDVRPYLRHAAAVVAPLRVARGVQNKVLEAMAMARPVVVGEAAAGGLDVRAGEEIAVAGGAEAFAAAVERLVAELERAAAMGQAARRCVQDKYSWAHNLAPILAALDGTSVMDFGKSQSPEDGSRVRERAA